MGKGRMLERDESCVYTVWVKKSFRFATPPNRSHSDSVPTVERRVREMVWGRGKTLMDARLGGE